MTASHKSRLLEPCQMAATMIVRDEGRSLLGCMESVRPWVDRIVVVDTGSKDATRQIARAFGACVYQIAWPDSFAAARNHALSLSNADWNLVIDADERVISGGEVLRSWASKADGVLGRVCIHSQFDPEHGSGEPLVDKSWITRMLPRSAFFEGRVHEQVQGEHPRERIPVHLAHDGYRNVQLNRKRDRNQPLLMADLADRPGDPYILYQLGRDADMRRDPIDAVCHYAASFAVAPAHATWRHSLVLSLLTALTRAGENEVALTLIEDMSSEWQHSPDFFFVAADVYLSCAAVDPTCAVNRWLPLACSAWKRCLILGEKPEMEGGVVGRGSYLARHNLDVVQSQLSQGLYGSTAAKQ